MPRFTFEPGIHDGKDRRLALIQRPDRWRKRQTRSHRLHRTWSPQRESPSVSRFGFRTSPHTGSQAENSFERWFLASIGRVLVGADGTCRGGLVPKVQYHRPGRGLWSQRFIGVWGSGADTGISDGIECPSTAADWWRHRRNWWVYFACRCRLIDWFFVLFAVVSYRLSNWLYQEELRRLHQKRDLQRQHVRHAVVRLR